MSLLVSSSIPLWRCNPHQIVGVNFMNENKKIETKLNELLSKLEILANTVSSVGLEITEIKNDIYNMKKDQRAIYPPTQPGGESAGNQRA